MSQSARNLVTLVVMAVLAAGVGLFAYFGVHEKDKAAAEKKDRAERFFAPDKPIGTGADAGVAKADFVRVIVTVESGKTVLERKAGEPWMVTFPVRAKADPLTVDGLVSQLQTARFKATVEETPDAGELAKYGLDKPSFTVEATVEVGEEKAPRTLKLFGGIENSFDGSIYMRRDDDPAVYLAEGGVRWALARGTFDLRDKSVLALDEAKVRGLSVKSKANSFQLERDAEKAWRIVKPTPSLADQNTVSTMISGLASSRAQGFPPDSPEVRKALGFDAPKVEATWTLEDGQTVRMVLAEPHNDAGLKLYALREDAAGAVLAEVPITTPSNLDKNVKELVDRTVVAFKKEQVTKVVFHNADGTEVVVEKDAPDASAEAWRVTAPKAGPAKVFKVAAVLWTLGSLKAAVVAEENPKDWAKYGLSAQARSISLSGVDGKELARFTIGAEVPGKPNAFYVRGTRNQVAEVDGSRFGELPSKAEDVLDAPPLGDAGT